MMNQAILKLLKSKGRMITLTKIKVGAYSPITGMAATTKVDHSIQGILINYKDSVKDSGRILQGDRMAIFAGLNVPAVPAVADQVKDGGLLYSIVDVHKLTENNNVVAYVCQVRV